MNENMSKHMDNILTEINEKNQKKLDEILSDDPNLEFAKGLVIGIGTAIIAEKILSDTEFIESIERDKREQNLTNSHQLRKLQLRKK